jgi:sulfate permease, SulP family
MASVASETTPGPLSLGAMFRGATAGVICGFLAIVQSVGFGMLLLVGEAEALTPIAIGMALFSTAVMAAAAAFSSSTPGVVAIAQGIPIAALAGPVSAIIARLGGGADATVQATVIAAVAIATIIIGVAAFLLGYLRLGRFIRFVPFPVIGGFLAGSGWLILFGGIGVIAGHSANFANIDLLTEPSTLLRFGGALAFLLPIVVLQSRLPIGLLLPAAALAAIVAFNLVASAAGISGDQLRSNNWLIAVADGGSFWPAVRPSDIALVDWWTIAGQLANLPTVVILTIIAVLMNVTGIELDARRDVDLDRELRSVGLQNLLGGAGGGIPGFHSVSLTALATRLGATNGLVGIIVAGFCAAALVFGDVVLALVPTPLLGGLLIWIGLSLLIEWLVRSYARLSFWEYLVIILIFAVIVLVSFAAGILTGLIAAAILFVVEYGQVEIVRHVMTGRDYQSSNDTSEERREALRTSGDAILIVRLQGFLFFGTADRLRKRIQQRIERHDGNPIRYLVVDFGRVSGLDSSTVLSFRRLAQMTGPGGFVLVLCGMSETVTAAMLRGSLDGDGAHVRFEHDLDHGLEWCENDLLHDVAPQVIGNLPLPVVDLLVEVVKDRALAEALLPYLERIEIAPDDKLIEQDTPSDDIYFVEQGRAAVELDANGHGKLRVATVGRGSIVGEMAFYLGKARSASVVAETPLVAWRFSAANLENLRRASPEAVIAFHRGMAGMLADRLTSTNQLVKLLAD